MEKKADNRKNTNSQSCPFCGQYMNIQKNVFCSNCGREFYSPVLSKKWSYKVVGIILCLLVGLYIIFKIAAPVLYRYIDTV